MRLKGIEKKAHTYTITLSTHTRTEGKTRRSDFNSNFGKETMEQNEQMEMRARETASERKRKWGTVQVIEDENSEHNHNNEPTNIVYEVMEQRTNALALLFQHSINKRKIHLIASTVFRAAFLSVNVFLLAVFFTAISVAMCARINRQ